MSSVFTELFLDHRLIINQNTGEALYQASASKIFDNVKPSQVKPEKFAGLPRPALYHT